MSSEQIILPSLRPLVTSSLQSQMGFMMCSIGIVGDVTEIEQYNKDLMSHLLLSVNLYHLFLY